MTAKTSSSRQQAFTPRNARPAALAVEFSAKPSTESARRELVKLLDHRTGEDGGHETLIPQLRFWRFSNPTDPMEVLQEAAVYVVVQGRKQVTVGGKRYIYDPSQYLAVSLDIPAVGNVLEATPDEPYLCMTLKVDPRELAALIVESGRRGPRDDHDGRGIYVSALEAPLLDCFLRLVRLLDTPDDISILGPLILRELHYRLLQTEQFGRLAQIAIGDSRLQRLSAAIAWIKEHFAEPLQIDELARLVNMSPSALHHHFKAVAAVSPVQYQKRLRLQEARKLLLSESTSAESVAYQVGYASPSQFNREYVRLFGDPPRRDAQRLRSAAAGPTGGK
jgi:AraC-like DNA-binding protein